MREQRRLAAIVPVNFSAKSVVGQQATSTFDIGRVIALPAEPLYDPE